ncbi:hypothetical protein KW796_00235 [Candidatus Parcubacteria bacterium]|nr:hypothetical protein [Candidatus Parcubacteria bacterium]
MKKIEFDKPLYIAAHFGFTPIEAPAVSNEDLRMTEDCEEKVEKTSGRFLCNAPEKAAFIRHYIERKLAELPHPLALSWRRGHNYSLELVGYPVGVAEAKLIRTSLSILSEEGYKGLVVEINSIGDKESIQAYERELSNFVRKVGHSISAELKKLFKEDIFAIAKAEGEEAEKLRKEMPPSVSSLSSASRAQFKEVIEYLEALGVDYRFAPELVGHKNFCSEALFAVRDDTEHLLAAGYRYSRLSRRFGFKKELALIGATIFGEKKPKERQVYKEAPKPKFQLVHLGREARIRALPLIELLRSSRIPIYHFLGKDKLMAQMETADRLRPPYLLIVGQKEALENTVTIRNVESRAQDTVPISNLPSFLKHLPF